MGLREKMDQNKKLFVAISVVLIGGSAVYGFLALRSETQLSGPVDQVYYSDDDGKTYFADSINKPFPFDHGGKQAYRAYVFTCDNASTPFVGLIGRQVITGKSSNSGHQVKDMVDPIEVRKPGDKTWVVFMSPAGQKLLGSVCPTGRPIAVQPGS